MSKMPEEIWAVPSYTGTDTGTYDALGEGDYNATKYIRADLTSQKQPEVTSDALEALGCYEDILVEALKDVDFTKGLVIIEKAIPHNNTIRTALTQSAEKDAVIRDLAEALKYTGEACLCDRYTARREHKGFDYGQKHPRMGKAKSGSRWITPSHRAYECLNTHAEAIKRTGG